MLCEKVSEPINYMYVKSICVMHVEYFYIILLKMERWLKNKIAGPEWFTSFKKT